MRVERLGVRGAALLSRSHAAPLLSSPPPHSGELKDIVAVPTSIATYNQAKGEREGRERRREREREKTRFAIGRERGPTSCEPCLGSHSIALAKRRPWHPWHVSHAQRRMRGRKGASQPPATRNRKGAASHPLSPRRCSSGSTTPSHRQPGAPLSLLLRRTP